MLPTTLDVLLGKGHSWWDKEGPEGGGRETSHHYISVATSARSSILVLCHKSLNKDAYFASARFLLFSCLSKHLRSVPGCICSNPLAQSRVSYCRLLRLVSHQLFQHLLSWQAVSSWAAPSLSWCAWLLLYRWRTWHLPLENIMSLSTHSFWLSMSPWIVGQATSAPTTPLSFIPAPSSRSLMQMLNSIYQPCYQPLGCSSGDWPPAGHRVTDHIPLSPTTRFQSTSLFPYLGCTSSVCPSGCKGKPCQNPC